MDPLQAQAEAIARERSGLLRTQTAVNQRAPHYDEFVKQFEVNAKHPHYKSYAEAQYNELAWIRRILIDSERFRRNVIDESNTENTKWRQGMKITVNLILFSALLQFFMLCAVITVIVAK